MDNTPDSPAKTPVGYTTQGGNYWTLITPEIWKVLHAVLHAAMLRALNISRIRLITNNPDKVAQLRQAGIEILEQIPTDTFLTAYNREYLTAKAQLTGHSLNLS